jgi:ribosomal protein L34E
MRPVVDKETMIAYCTECSKPLNHVSIFMRRQMVSFNQVKTNVKKKLAWSVHCKACEKDGPPTLSKEDDLVCGFCSKPLSDLSKPFAQMIKVNLKAQKRANGNA